MKEHTAAQAPVMAFYSRPFYRDLAFNGKGVGFLYLFLLLLVCWSCLCARNFWEIQTGVHSKETTALVDQLPNMHYSQEKMSIDKPTPYAITIKNTPQVYFDMTGKMKSLSDAAPADILITDTFMIVRKDPKGGTEETIPWKAVADAFKVSEFKFGPGMVKEFLYKLPLFFGVVSWVLGIFVWIGHMIVALFLGVFGLIMDRKKLGYLTAVRMGSFAMTPSVILSTLKDLVPLHIDGWIWSLIALVMSIGFLYLGYSAVNEDNQPV